MAERDDRQGDAVVVQMKVSAKEETEGEGRWEHTDGAGVRDVPLTGKVAASGHAETTDRHVLWMLGCTFSTVRTWPPPPPSPDRNGT